MFLGAKRGFTLVEILVSVAVFVLISVGIYSLISYVFKVVYLSRVQILSTQIANEKLEIIRNLPYEKVGTVGGVPVGVLAATETITRSRTNFQVNITIRNIDDPFDGTIGGMPNDTSPADYKMAEVAVVCLSCQPQPLNPVILNTTISPKGLESASQNGSLFITVFDAVGQPVPGATVQVANPQVNPPVSISDVTDIQGKLQIIDTATSTEGYQIQASKNGYSTDYTVLSSPGNPNPLKPPATVASQTATNISFSIDKVSVVSLSTINYLCQAIPNIGFQVSGSKLLGVNPDIFKYNQTITTNASGIYSLNNLEWDTYKFITNSASYDITGAIPILPIALNPDSTQDLAVILKPHTTNSLLITVKDSSAKLPLSNASTTIINGQNSFNLLTGYGYARQTDWSGGAGQENFIDETSFFSQDGSLEVSQFPGDVKLKKIGHEYQAGGYLISSTIDFGRPSNFANLVWEPLDQPSQAGADSLKFQIATSASSSPQSWNFVGPDNTADTFYTISNTNINPSHNGDRYLRYKVFLSTENQNFTPQLSEFSINFTSGCTPPGQVFFSNLAAGVYDLNITLSGYQTVETAVEVNGRSSIEVLMSP